MSKQVLVALCDLYWLTIAFRCTRSIRSPEKDIVLRGEKPLASEHAAWFSVVFSEGSRQDGE